MYRVLIVEDEPSYVEALEVTLGKEGFETEAAMDGRSGLAVFSDVQPDLVLLDLMLPEMSGLDVLRRVREHSDVPVIVLSAKDAEADVVTALELGADDYLTKPYSVRELVARIRAAMRRSAGVEDSNVLSAGIAVLDPGRYQLRLDRETFDLPRKEFEVMQKLMSRPGRVVSRDELFEDIWGFG